MHQRAEPPPTSDVLQALLAAADLVSRVTGADESWRLGECLVEAGRQVQQ